MKKYTFLLFFGSFLLPGVIPVFSQLNQDGFPDLCPRYIQVCGAGCDPWSTPPTNNVFSDNQVYSVVNLGGPGNISDYLTPHDFDFTIPGGSTITGIYVFIQRYAAGGDVVIDDIFLYTDWMGTESAHRSSATIWPGSDGWEFFGNSADDWGRTWTDAEVNSTDFGIAVRVRADDLSPNAYIDVIGITIYYNTGMASLLADFQVKNSGKSFILSWSVPSEGNISAFVVERSPDGINFEETGSVKPDLTDSENTYTYTDHPETCKSSLHYRVKQVNSDGGNFYSKIAAVAYPGGDDCTDGKMFVYPNPSRGEINITLDEKYTSQAQINVYSVSGEKVFSGPYPGSTLKLTGLASGSYYVGLMYFDSEKKSYQALKKSFFVKP